MGPGLPPVLTPLTVLQGEVPGWALPPAPGASSVPTSAARRLSSGGVSVPPRPLPAQQPLQGLLQRLLALSPNTFSVLGVGEGTGSLEEPDVPVRPWPREPQVGLESHSRADVLRES